MRTFHFWMTLCLLLLVVSMNPPRAAAQEPTPPPTGSTCTKEARAALKLKQTLEAISRPVPTWLAELAAGCEPSPIPCDPTGAAQCDDKNPATADLCLPNVGCISLAPGSTCSPLDTTPCNGVGTCIESAGNKYICQCANGYAGRRCDKCADGWHAVAADGTLDIVESGDHTDGTTADVVTSTPSILSCVKNTSCAVGQCGPFGTCDDSRGTPLCLCNPGHTGDNCNECAPYLTMTTEGCVPGTECAEALCGNRGDCVDDGETLACDCNEGFSGTRCENCADGFVENNQTCVPKVVCTATSCANGTCIDTTGIAQCKCDSGWGGTWCDETCSGNTCNNNGICTVSNLGAICKCNHPDLDPAFDCASCGPGLVLVSDATGKVSCVLDKTENPCIHGEYYEDPTGGPSGCICEPGWEGTSCWRCGSGNFEINGMCLNPKECANNLCSNRGKCQIEDKNSVICLCDPGASGEDCANDLPVAAYEVSGHDGVLEVGGSTVLSAKALGVGTHDTLVWEFVSGPGTLLPIGSGEAIFLAPTSMPEGFDVSTIKVYPACCPNQGTTLGLSYTGPQMPWVTGTPNPTLKPVDQRILQFMYDRCTGGAVLGINWKGIPIYRRGYGRNTGRSTSGRPGVDCGAADPNATPVWPNSPVRVGSNTKAFTAAMVRQVIEWRLYLQGRLPDPSDDNNYATWRAKVDQAVENVRILDVDIDLVPKELRDILGTCKFNKITKLYSCQIGTVPAPVTFPLNDNTGPSACDGQTGNICYNGGTCVQIGPNNFACQCAVGFLGATCRQIDPNNAWYIGPNGTDTRWIIMTLGHLFGHTSGLPRGTTSQTTMLANLFELRGYHDPNFDNILDVGPALHKVNPAFPEPPLGTIGPRVLSERVSSYEYILAQAGRILEQLPGTTPSAYSNLGFVFLGVIAEHMKGQTDWEYGYDWAGATDHHTDHLGSLLDEFTKLHLGGWPGDPNEWGAGRSRYGAFLARTPNPKDPVGTQTDPAELQPRDFSGGVWNPPADDEKGAVCQPNAMGTCDFSLGIIDGFGNIGQVPYGFNGDLMEASAGAMIIEADLYLRFMKKFIVGFGTNYPGYGRRRLSFSQSSSHNGQWVGARSSVRQIGWTVHPSNPTCTAKWAPSNPWDGSLTCPPGGTCCPTNYDCVYASAPSFPVSAATVNNQQCILTTSYRVPIVSAATGDYTVDSAATGTRRCVLPEGLDVFVTTNQASDGQDTGGRDYDYLIDAVYAGLCQVNWPLSPAVMLPKGNNIMAPKP